MITPNVNAHICCTAAPAAATPFDAAILPDFQTVSTVLEIKA